MKISEHLKNTKNTLVSFEILPPTKGKGIQSIFDSIDPLMEFKPPFIDVTYHREEYVYKKRENGLLEKRTTRKRPGTVGICAAIMNKYGIEAVPHIICGGFTKEDTENALIDLNFLGVENVLALRGDPIKTERNFEPEQGGHKYASELIEQISNMNNGKYIDDELDNVSKSNFCIGVAGYPEKHFESPNLSTDLKHLKRKIDLGAEYIVTQMFFDNQKYFDFVNKCRESGINVPIIPGLKPITSINQMSSLPQIFHVDIPEDLSVELEKCNSRNDILLVSKEWSIQQAKELIKFGAPCLHYYTMGKPDLIQSIIREI